MLRGNATATVDDKGRFKLPSQFRAYIEETWGKKSKNVSPSYLPKILRRKNSLSEPVISVNKPQSINLDVY
jgi:hypothetical protein